MASADSSPLQSRRRNTSSAASRSKKRQDDFLFDLANVEKRERDRLVNADASLKNNEPDEQDVNVQDIHNLLRDFKSCARAFDAQNPPDNGSDKNPQVLGAADFPWQPTNARSRNNQISDVGSRGSDPNEEA